MQTSGLGDLSRLLQQQSQYAQLRRDIDTLGQELATGRKSDLIGALAGDFSPLAGIEHSLARLESYKIASQEADSYSNVMQNALNTVSDLTIETGTAILTASQGNASTFSDAAVTAAEQAFRGVVGALNTQFGDRSVFSGQATDQPALASVDDMLATLRPLLAGLTTASDVATAVDTWFAPGGGFDTLGYQGSTGLPPMQVGPGVSVDLSVTASDSRLRDVLSSFALGALANDPSLVLPADESVTLLSDVGERLTVRATQIASVQAEIGAAQSQIESSNTARDAEIAALEFSRVDLIAADPFETASNFEQAQSQLETFFAVMVRMSNLKLVNYLR